MYVVIYADYESSDVLWVGDREGVVQAVQECREGVENAVRARDEILTPYDNLDDVTDEMWEEYHRRCGVFRNYDFGDPSRVCVLKQVEKYVWECCCKELGV